MTEAGLASIGLGRPFDQVCVVVTDLDAAVAAYGAMLGITAWIGWRYDGDYLAHRTYRGAVGDWTMRVAVTTDLKPQLELAEPGGGPSILRDHIKAHGPGLQHVGYFVPAFEPVRVHLEAHGAILAQGGGGHGLDGDGRFGYFVLPPLGIVVEVIEPPARRAAPHFTWGNPRSSGER